MNFKIENLNIDNIIIHQIFEKDIYKNIKEPIYNNQFTTLDITGLSVLEQRITDALSNNSHSMPMEIVDINPNSTFSYVTKGIKVNDTMFIDISKEMTYKLALSQTSRRIPGGIVVIMRGTVGVSNRPFLGILKAEIQQGFMINQSNSQLLLNYVSNLLLTPQQKFYKIGFFINVEECDIDDPLENQLEKYLCYVYDNNIRNTSIDEAAQYFYGTFLGCTFLKSNKQLTKQFYVSAKDFINRCDSLSDEEKLELNYALYTYLKVDQNNIVNVDDFATSYLKQDLLDSFRSYMLEKEVPLHAIEKDISLLDKTLKKRKIKFSSDVSISAPSAGFNELINIAGKDGEWTLIKIKGNIENQE